MRTQDALSIAAALCVAFTATLAPAATPPKVCELLDAQTAASLAGSAVGSPMEVPTVVCGYSSAGATVSLALRDMPGTSGGEAIQAMKRTTLQGAQTESIPGLGEQNFLIVKTPNQNSLTVLYHKKLLSLSVQRRMTPELKTAMVQAMRQMLSKL
jgi:hypothetical protein